MKQLGLIGKNIAYSFSKKYFGDKFKQLGIKDFQYDIFDLPNINDVENILNQENLIGLNVTIPYKVDVIPFLDELSEEAKEIGAVNTIKIDNNKRIGFNTDVFGFEKSLEKVKQNHQKTALILGNGGAAKAVKFILKKHHIDFKTVSRKGELNFENLTSEIVEKHFIIIQCTPVGTHPHIEEHVPFPFEALSEKHSIIDLIYNPEETAFIKKAKEQGAKTLNGLLMLEQQAEKSWEIWNN